MYFFHAKYCLLSIIFLISFVNAQTPDEEKALHALQLEEALLKVGQQSEEQISIRYFAPSRDAALKLASIRQRAEEFGEDYEVDETGVRRSSVEFESLRSQTNVFLRTMTTALFGTLMPNLDNQAIQSLLSFERKWAEPFTMSSSQSLL